MMPLRVTYACTNNALVQGYRRPCMSETGAHNAQMGAGAHLQFQANCAGTMLKVLTACYRTTSSFWWVAFNHRAASQRSTNDFAVRLCIAENPALLMVCPRPCAMEMQSDTQVSDSTWHTPSGLRLTERSDRGFPSAGVHAKLWHAHWHLDRPYFVRPTSP